MSLAISNRIGMGGTNGTQLSYQYLTSILPTIPWYPRYTAYQISRYLHSQGHGTLRYYLETRYYKWEKCSQ